MVRSVLGDPKLFPAHELPRTPETAGIGFTSTSRGVVKYRGALTSNARSAIAARMAEDSAYYRRQTSTPTQQEDGA
jgi:hypothetical protein